MEAVVEKVNILDVDAVGISEMIQRKEVTATSVTEVFIERIREKNPTVNFLTEDRFAEAMKEAKMVDENLSDGQSKGALYGVPITMKESFDVEGMRTTGGLKSKKDRCKVRMQLLFPS